jgi:hypothetical protein
LYNRAVGETLTKNTKSSNLCLRGVGRAESLAECSVPVVVMDALWGWLSEKQLLILGFLRVSTCDLAPDGRPFVVILYPDGTVEQKPITCLAFPLSFFES